MNINGGEGVQNYSVKTSKIEKINGHKLMIKGESIYIDGKKIILNNYSVSEIIGSGANGVVLKGTENITNLTRAIKIWLPNSSKGKSNKTRGVEEIKKISKLEHKNIVKYYATGESCGYKFCILEKIDGISLKRYLKDFSPGIVIRYDILSKILEALRYSHEHNIYHGDLHEDNVLIEKDGNIKVLDFGTSCFGKESSMIRDSRLLYNTGIDILRGYIDKNILCINKNEIKKLSPKVVRLILKAASKITVLLNFLSNGVVDTIIEDISLFSMVVPFFDLKYISIIISRYKSSSRGGEENGILFMEQLIYDGSSKILQYGLYDEFKEIDKVNIYEFYKMLRMKFVTKVNSTTNEEPIYFDYNEAKLFNGKLYSDISNIYQPKNDVQGSLEYNDIRKLLDDANSY